MMLVWAFQGCGEGEGWAGGRETAAVSAPRSRPAGTAPQDLASISPNLRTLPHRRRPLARQASIQAHEAGQGQEEERGGAGHGAAAAQRSMGVGAGGQAAMQAAGGVMEATGCEK